jgi:general secretion pathway protein B
MSFILDALRKSENERQQSSARRLSEMPTVVHRNKVPLWMMGTTIGLTAGIFLLGWAWLNDVSPRNQEVNATAENILDESPQVGLIQTPTSSRSEPANIPRLLIESDQPIPPSEQAITSENSLVELVSTQAVLVPNSAAIPSMADLLSYGTKIPELVLELHAFSVSPTDRFVFINSSKYLEGESITEETGVVTITEEGVVITHRNQLFLLPRQ